MHIKSNEMTTQVREHMRGGEGAAVLKIVAEGANLPKNCRFSALISLEPGSSIGYHVHEKETEIFYFITGAGIVDDNGVKGEVAPGDCVITPSGTGHSVQCTGQETLSFLAVIILD